MRALAMSARIDCRGGAARTMSRTNVAQTLLSVPGLATTHRLQTLKPAGSAEGTDKSVCAT